MGHVSIRKEKQEDLKTVILQKDMLLVLGAIFSFM